MDKKAYVAPEMEETGLKIVTAPMCVSMQGGDPDWNDPNTPNPGDDF
ncbi:MAG: hypothetical protein J6T00_00305 [Bacteroidaceae bacterium]|nr:hypothetical protein [Bacteroidaceae bacterium]